MADVRRGPGRRLLTAHHRLVLAVTRRRLRDRWREWRTGQRRRWDVAMPPAGAPPGEYVRVRGGTATVPRRIAGDEYEPVPERPPPLVAWRSSDFWTRRDREPASPSDWRPAPRREPRGSAR